MCSRNVEKCVMKIAHVSYQFSGTMNFIAYIILDESVVVRIP